MKRESIAIFAIIAAGSFLGLAYGVTNGSILTGDLTVTGTCTGCGGGESSFTNYNTVDFNNTLGLAGTDAQIRTMQISNNGTVLAGGQSFNLLIQKSGVVSFQHSTNINSGGSVIAQSSTGKYQLVINDDATPIISVYKNSVFLQTLSINMAIFSAPSGNSALGISISPDGKYIGVLSEDSGAADDRLLIFRGT